MRAGCFPSYKIPSSKLTKEGPKVNYGRISVMGVMENDPTKITALIQQSPLRVGSRGVSSSSAGTANLVIRRKNTSTKAQNSQPVPIVEVDAEDRKEPRKSQNDQRHE